MTPSGEREALRFWSAPTLLFDCESPAADLRRRCRARSIATDVTLSLQNSI